MDGLGVFRLFDEDLVGFLLRKLSGRALARLQVTCKSFSLLIHDDHELWDALTYTLCVANSLETPSRCRTLAKERYLALSRSCCSSCGDNAVDLQLSSLRLYYCSACVGQFTERMYHLRVHNETIASYVKKVEVVKRRRSLSEVWAAASRVSAVFSHKQVAPAVLLYSTAYHGRSLSTLFQKCEDRENIVTVLETDSGKTIGCFTPTAWRANAPQKEYGSPHSFLFSISPLEVKIFTANAGLGQQISSRGEGLALGKVEQSAALAVDANLERGASSPSLAFCNPGLCSRPQFSISKVEVWGLSTRDEVDKAEASQESHDLECEVLTALDYDLAQMRGRSKPSVLKRGVERFMLSFIGNAGPIAAAMHARSNC